MNRHGELITAITNLLKIKKYTLLQVQYRCFHCGQIFNSGAAGMPDIYIISPIHLAIEVKIGKDRLSERQEYVRQQILKAGDDYLIIKDTVDELIKYFKSKNIL